MKKRQATLNDLILERFLREREQGLIVYKTEEGIEIPINRMSDKHLNDYIEKNSP